MRKVREKGRGRKREGGKSTDSARVYVYESTGGYARVRARSSVGRYELPKLPFDSSDKLCKQFDRRSYRFAVEL